MTANIRTVTVLEGIVVILRGGHHDGVQSRETAAVASGQIDVKLDGTSKQIGLEVSRGIQSGRRRQIHTVVPIEID